MGNELFLNKQRSNAEVALSRDSLLFIERYLIEADVAASTKDTYRKGLRQFFRWWETRGGGELARADVLAFKQDKLVHLQANTVGAYLSALKGFFTWLEAEKLYPNVAAGVKGTKVFQGHKKDALTPSQVGHVLEALKGSSELELRNYAIVNLLVRTGLRTIEVHRANIDDIRNNGAATVLYIQGKGHQSKDDFVVLTDAAARPIYAYLAARKERNASAPLFASMSNKTMGKRLSARSLREIVKDALRAASLDSPRITTHSLRHSAVSLALIGGASLQQAQAMARHSSITTTMIYAHNLDRIGNAAENVIDGILKDI